MATSFLCILRFHHSLRKITDCIELTEVLGYVLIIKPITKILVLCLRNHDLKLNTSTYRLSTYDQICKSKPSGKLGRLTPSFGCILAVRPKKYFFLGIKLFCFSRQKAETFRFSLKFKFVKPHKLSTHLAFSDDCYFHLFLSVV